MAVARADARLSGPRRHRRVRRPAAPPPADVLQPVRELALRHADGRDPHRGQPGRRRPRAPGGAAELLRRRTAGHCVRRVTRNL